MRILIQNKFSLIKEIPLPIKIMNEVLIFCEFHL